MTAPFNGSTKMNNGDTNGNSRSTTANISSVAVDSLQLENLLLRDEDIFQTSLNSEDYLESLAPILKDAIRANGLSNLITRLNEIVKDKDEELNVASMESTDEISQCINKIDSIHQESMGLKDEFTQVNSNLNKSTIELINRKNRFIKYKTVCGRINETSIVFTECIQVLELTNKILESIGTSKYFNALKLLDELLNIHIAKVQDFSFAKKIVDSIPNLTTMIKQKCFENISKWLSLNLEQKLPTVGHAIFNNIHVLQKNWENIKKNNKTFLPYKLNSPVEQSLRDPGINYNIFNDSSLSIPLNSIYDAILVYQTLHELDTLIDIYHKEWMVKYSRVIYPLAPASEIKERKKDIDFTNLQLAEYLQKISAFFIMDKQLNLITKFQLRTNSQADELWLSYTTKLKPVLLHNLSRNKFKNVKDLKEYKDLIGDFLQVMDNYSYDITELYDVLMIIFKDYFASLVVQDFRSDFINSITSDHYMPLVVDSKEDYDDIMKLVWYQKDSAFAPQNVTSFPIQLPFSEDYIHYCLGIRNLLNVVLVFISEHYNYEITEINNIIVNNIVELVLGNKRGFGIAYDIEDFVRRNSNSKEIVAQTFINLEYYLFSLYEVGRMINLRLRQYTGVGIHNIDVNDTFTLHAVDIFKDLKKFSEKAIFDMVDSKINELLDMVEYFDYTTTEQNTEANYSVKDFAGFLVNLFTSIFSSLPTSLRTLGLFKTYDFVSEHFLNVLKEAKVYNRNFIENFDLDIRYLEESMRQLHSPKEGKTEALESTFAELRQAIDVLKLKNYDEFLNNPNFRMRHFDRIKLEFGQALIAKMKDGHQNSAIDDDSSSIKSVETSNTSTTTSKLAQFTGRFKRREDY
ncbi:Exocyst complex component SEC15 [Spathaspora sp. JA1]|nr:Exocyst complex component SEC15 [Spathaspora sp. JA1]